MTNPQMEDINQQRFEELQGKFDPYIQEQYYGYRYALDKLNIIVEAKYKPDRWNYKWYQWEKLTSQHQQAFLNLCIERVDRELIGWVSVGGSDNNKWSVVLNPRKSAYYPTSPEKLRVAMSMMSNLLCLEGKHNEALELVHGNLRYIK